MHTLDMYIVSNYTFHLWTSTDIKIEYLGKRGNMNHGTRENSLISLNIMLYTQKEFEHFEHRKFTIVHTPYIQHRRHVFQLRRFLKHQGPTTARPSVVGCVALLIFSTTTLDSFQVLQTLLELDPKYLTLKKYEGILYFLYCIWWSNWSPAASLGNFQLHSFVLYLISASASAFASLLLPLPVPLVFVSTSVLPFTYFIRFNPPFPRSFQGRTGPRSTLWLLSQIRTSCSCLAKGKTISPCRPRFLSFVHQFLALATIMAAHEPRSSR